MKQSPPSPGTKRSARLVRRAAHVCALAGAVLLAVSLASSLYVAPGSLLLLFSLPLYFSGSSKLKGYTFTGWVIVCVAAALFYPNAFIAWNEFRLESLIIPLTQLIMFGMGATLSVSDFTRIARSPLPVITGAFLQFLIMPLVGFSIARVFGFEGGIAAGIVLIGSVSGGMASNLMTYLAGGNVALSVTMTFISTLLSPVFTPLLMSWLAGTFVTFDTVKMMWSIINMIIVPLAAGLIAHELIYSEREKSAAGLAFSFLVPALFAALVVWLLGPRTLGPLYAGGFLGCCLVAAVTLAKIFLTAAGRNAAVLRKLLPGISMASICIVLIIIIAQTREMFFSVGLVLLWAAMLHNGIGFGLGYSAAKLVGRLAGLIGRRMGMFAHSRSRLSESECRTIAIEVGMQNGGMATGIAIDVLKNYAAALPPNLFGTWMNISGSLLANYWHQRPPRGKNMDAPGNSIPDENNVYEQPK